MNHGHVGRPGASLEMSGNYSPATTCVGTRPCGQQELGIVAASASAHGRAQQRWSHESGVATGALVYFLAWLITSVWPAALKHTLAHDP